MSKSSRGVPPLDLPRTLTRRQVLAGSAAAAAVALLRPGERAVAIPVRSRRPLAAHAPAIVDPVHLRDLARTAIDAATSAGAEYADIRIGDRREYRDGLSAVGILYGFGVRVRVGGAWAFAAGADPTVDGIARAARSAAETARRIAPLTKNPRPWVPAPVVTGEWRDPVQIDPFSVAPGEILDVLTSFSRVRGLPLRASIGDPFSFRTETRVCATSEGTLVTQTLTRVLGGVNVALYRRVPTFCPQAGGLELLLGPERHDQIAALYDETVPLLKLPLGVAEIGRKEVVLDGQAHGSILGETLLPAFSLSRVLGEEQDARGTSFLSPMPDILGAPLFSKLVNLDVSADANRFARSAWDDEGVVPTGFPLMTGGAVVNYCGTRRTRSALSAWEHVHGTPAAEPAGIARGEARVFEVTDEPMGAPAAIRMPASPSTMSLDELVRSVQDGYVVRDTFNVMGDHQGAGGVLGPRIMLEVKRGKIVRRIIKTRIEMATRRFWSPTSVVALGDASTAATVLVGRTDLWGGPPLQSLEVPAIHVRGADILPDEIPLRGF